MSQIFAIHRDNPQSRLLRQAAHVIASGGLVVYPTDSGYAVGCRLGDGIAAKRVRCLRQLDCDHKFSMLCRDIPSVAEFVNLKHHWCCVVKALTPGPYTFVIEATPEVPNAMVHAGRQTLGLRIPNHPITLGLLEHHGSPIMSTTLRLPGAEAPLSQPDAIRDLVGLQVDLVIDGGHCGYHPTTVVDLTQTLPQVLRHGSGDAHPFESSCE